MTTYRRLRSKTASDLISQLPEDLKHRILECLSTQEAARTALLSTQWHGVWLRHGRLVFDESPVLVKTITSVLLLRSGPVKKFTFLGSLDGPAPEKSDLDLWCLFLSRNGIEKHKLSIPDHKYTENKYTLPFCLISCPTIKHLKLEYVDFCFPANPRLGIMFPGVTYLRFNAAKFKRNASGFLLKIPNLEELAFYGCTDIDNFVISAPKLKSLTFKDCLYATEWKWFELHFPVIKTLKLSAYMFADYGEDFNALERLPTAMNLQVVELDDLCFACPKCLPLVIQFLKKCPNLFELELNRGFETHYGGADPSILENPDDWFNNQDLCKLKTVRMMSFRGLRLEMLLIKTILSKSPTLEKVLIQEYNHVHIPVTLKITREMIRFPRASPVAQVIFLDTE